MAVPAPIPWQVPWSEITDPGRRAHFEAELARELAQAHVLYGQPARAIGERQDCDDVLFELTGTPSLAVVHLTYVRPPPDRPPWPTTEIYADVAAFVEERLIADHDAFGED